MQGYAAKTVFEALQAQACHENMVKVGSYILGKNKQILTWIILVDKLLYNSLFLYVRIAIGDMLFSRLMFKIDFCFYCEDSL